MLQLWGGPQSCIDVGERLIWGQCDSWELLSVRLGMQSSIQQQTQTRPAEAQTTEAPKGFLEKVPEFLLGHSAEAQVLNVATTQESSRFPQTSSHHHVTGKSRKVRSFQPD